MKSVLIFSTCLVLILLLLGMPKRDVREFDISSDLQLVITDESMSGICFADNFILVSYSYQESNQQNMTRSFSIIPHRSNKSPVFSRLFYMPQIVGWARWITVSYRRRRPYRNPLRRFRLNKKQRRRLLKHLSSLLAPENSHRRDNFSSNVGWV